MTRRRRTSPPPLPSSTSRSRRYIHDEDLDDDLSTITDNYNDSRDDISESDHEPVLQSSRKAICKRPSEYSFTSTLGQRVAAAQLTPISVQRLHPESREVYIVSEEEDECEPAPLASKMVSNSAFEWLNPPANVYIYKKKDSNEAGEQLVAWTAGNLWRYEPFVADVTGLIVGAKYNSQTTLWGGPAMVMACVKPIAIKYAMFVNSRCHKCGEDRPDS